MLNLKLGKCTQALGLVRTHPPAWREGRVGAVPLLLGGARGRSEAEPTAWSFPVRAHVRRAQRVAYARAA